MNQAWVLIFIAASITFGLRASPFVLSRILPPLSERWLKAFDLTAIAIVGGLVAEGLVFSENRAMRITFCLIAFLTSSLTKRPTLVFYTLFGAFYFFV